MLYEAFAAALVALAVVAAIVGPLTRPGTPGPGGADEPDDFEDTPKGIALAALREIEFDRATGKLSEEDYAELKSKYTVEALAVLRAEEAPPASAGDAAPPAVKPGDPVEALIADRVKKLKESGIRCPQCGPRPESDALFCSSCGRSLSPAGCAECGVPLVPGSRYCENCGVAVEV